MVAQNMCARMKKKKAFSREEYPICDCFRYDQMTYTDQIRFITPYVRTYFHSYISTFYIDSEYYFLYI